MATKTGTATGIDVESREWLLGAGGGILGGVLFGLFMQFVMKPPVLEMAIPAMYGIQGPALTVGWALHLFHSVVVGLGYVAVVNLAGRTDLAASVGGGAALGAVYGAISAVVLAWLVMPLWLSAVGFGGAPPFPNVNPVSLLGHVVYGVPLGIVYALAVDG